MQSCSATIEYRGRSFVVTVARYWVFTNPKGLQSKSIFYLYVDKFFKGQMARNESGIWELLDKDKMKPGHEEFNRLVGELAERELAEWV